MLFKKMIRDILKNKSQFVTIFIMCFLAIFAFSGIHAYMDGMKASSVQYYENQNLQDLWLTSENFNGERMSKIKSISNVKDVERYVRIKANVLDCEKYKNPMDGKEITDLVFECNFIESNNINKMYLIDGESFSKEKSGLWLDHYLARNLGIKVGDEIELSMEGTAFKEKVAGIIEAPDHVYCIKDESNVFPTHTDFGVAYLSINEFPKDYIYQKVIDKMNVDKKDIDDKETFIKTVMPDFNINDYIVFPFAMVDIDDTSRLDETKAKIKNDVDGIITATTRDEDISYAGYKSEYEEGETYSGVFSGLFVFIAILSVVTTMNRFVKKERTQIGTLKALGFKKSKITLMYVSYGFVISLLAGIIGIVLGNAVLGEFFLNQEMEYYEIPYYHIITTPIVYCVTIGVVAVITAVTYLSCRKVLKEPAAQAIRIEIPKVKVNTNGFTTKSFFNKLSLSTKWNLRDIARSKARTIMALAGIAGCTMLIVTALGMRDSINSYIDWEFSTINHFEYKLSLAEDYTEKQFDDIVKEYGNQTSQTLGIEFKNNDKIVVKQLTVNDADELLQVTDHNKKPFKMNDDGFFITEKMAEVYKLGVGDQIEWHIIGSNKWHTSKVSGINRDPQFQQFYCTRKYYDTVNEEYKADSVYTNKDLSQVKEIPGVSIIQSISKLREGMMSMLGMMYMLIAILIAVSSILAVVIIYNLGVLSFGEKEYQFATLKVLGFMDKKIKEIFIKQNIWITICAIVLALPLGNLMTDYIFTNAIGDSYDFSADISVISFVISAVCIFVVSFIVNKFLSKKVRKIDMVTSLKANE